MAGEIKVTLNAAVNNGSFKELFQPGQQSINQTTTVSMQSASVSVTTTASTMYLGGLTNPGVSWFTNLDPTNYIIIGPASTGGMNAAWRMNATESWILRLTTGTTYFMEADTSPCQMRYTVLGN